MNKRAKVYQNRPTRFVKDMTKTFMGVFFGDKADD